MSWLALGVNPSAHVNVSGHVGVSLSVWVQIAILAFTAASCATAGSYAGVALTRRKAAAELERYLTRADAARREGQQRSAQRARRALAAELSHIAGMNGALRVLDSYALLPRLDHVEVISDLPHPIMAAVLQASRSVERFNAAATGFNGQVNLPPSAAAELAMAVDHLGAEAVAYSESALEALQELLDVTEARVAPFYTARQEDLGKELAKTARRA